MGALGGFSEKTYTAIVNTSSSGDNTLVSAPGSGKKIFVDFISIIPTTAVSVTFKSGSTAITGPYPLDDKQAIVFENSPRLEHGLIECADNEALVMNLGSAVQVGGFVKYRISNG